MVNAARGFSSLLADPATVSPGGLRDRVRVEAPDREALLAALLNQLLRLFENEREVFCRFQIRRITPALCEMETDGELWDPGRHQARWALAPLAPTDVSWETAPGEERARLRLSLRRPAL